MMGMWRIRGIAPRGMARQRGESVSTSITRIWGRGRRCVSPGAPAARLRGRTPGDPAAPRRSSERSDLLGVAGDVNEHVARSGAALPSLAAIEVPVLRTDLREHVGHEPLLWFAALGKTPQNPRKEIGYLIFLRRVSFLGKICPSNAHHTPALARGRSAAESSTTVNTPPRAARR